MDFTAPKRFYAVAAVIYVTETTEVPQEEPLPAKKATPIHGSLGQIPRGILNLAGMQATARDSAYAAPHGKP